MLQFDAETTRLLEISYQGADTTRRRQMSFDALAPRPGETIVDIGCGNGMLTIELARALGTDGRVIGIEPSQNMGDAARLRCADFETVRIESGTAGQLPVDDASVDKAVSIQVFEYLDDIPAAVAEVFRVLKPGGLAVIGDVHFDSLIWFSDNPDRMARMIASWDHHLVERCVPAILPKIMTDAGFVVTGVRPHTICDTHLKPDGLARMLLRLMEGYAVENGHFSPEDARAWAAEQEDLARQGRFFFSVSHFVVSARKPDAG